MSTLRARPKRLPRRQNLERLALIDARALVDRMRSVYRELEQSTGAPIAVHRLLHCIDVEPGIGASRLAEQLGMTRPNVSHLLRIVTTQGWVQRTRDADDQRTVHLRLTPSGRAMVGATHGRVAGLLQQAIEGLNFKDLVQLQRSFRALIPHLPEPRSAQPRPRPRSVVT